MQALISIFRQVHDPRDVDARRDCASMLFVALMATLCGPKTCVDIADFAAANERALAEIVDLPHGAPSHDSFSRLFRLLDPEEMASISKAASSPPTLCIAIRKWPRRRVRGGHYALKLKANNGPLHKRAPLPRSKRPTRAPSGGAATSRPPNSLEAEPRLSSARARRAPSAHSTARRSASSVTSSQFK